MRLIDADALANKLYRNEPGFIGESRDMARRFINAAPTVDAKLVMRGKWIPDNELPDLYSCSVCGVKDHREPKHNYCPNCGVKMEEGND